jgi:hypothetical protein
MVQQKYLMPKAATLMFLHPSTDIWRITYVDVCAKDVLHQSDHSQLELFHVFPFPHLYER